MSQVKLTDTGKAAGGMTGNRQLQTSRQRLSPKTNLPGGLWWARRGATRPGLGRTLSSPAASSAHIAETPDPNPHVAVHMLVPNVLSQSEEGAQTCSLGGPGACPGGHTRGVRWSMGTALHVAAAHLATPRSALLASGSLSAAARILDSVISLGVLMTQTWLNWP